MALTIAVAGGTGSLGRAIVQAILADSKFKIIILSRTAKASIQHSVDVPVIPIDYTRAVEVAEVLEKHQVHTLISTIDPTSGPQAEFALIEAAEKVETTKRFIPSIWGVKYSKEHGQLFPLAKTKLEILDRLQPSHLEWTAWYFGLFAEFLAHRPSPLPILIDMHHDMAVVPGSGDISITVAFRDDVASFVAASLNLPRWPPETYLIGDSFTPNQLVEVAEAIKGTKFSVTNESLDGLKAGKLTELPSQTAMAAYMPPGTLSGILAFFMTLFGTGAMNFQDVSTINAQFPELKTTSVKDSMSKAWGLK
ncbi:nmra-like family [Fusarium pseudocircinatum]|uniref:Nmra-like family n=1 Tax=Fusarium pseudocircinatum TaxID=56676 RepID=A0A8H5KJR0_9HYPO|nr:nmra-like family [Fusarium pseudocircinatum]